MTEPGRSTLATGRSVGQTSEVAIVAARRRPSNPLLELRTPFEFWLFVASNPLFRLAPRGDGSSVLVLPGFTASDTSTLPLRTLMRQLGHRPAGWGQGRNMGPKSETLSGVLERLQELVRENGAPIPIVGWSLGGVYARLVAQEHPHLVSQVISLGSPFNLAAQERTSLTPVWEYLKARGGFVRDQENVDLDQLPVPSTSIYTKSDGVVSWESCIQSPGEQAENIEVRGSHTGLGVNVAAALIMADRLAQPGEEWTRFEPSRKSRWLFPNGDSPIGVTP